MKIDRNIVISKIVEPIYFDIFKTTIYIDGDKIRKKKVVLNIDVFIDIYNNHFLKGTRIDRKFLESYDYKSFGPNGRPCRVMLVLVLIELFSGVKMQGNGTSINPHYIQKP